MLGPIELWTISAAIGLATGIYGIREAILDLRALGEVKNGTRLIARQRLAAQVFRTIITGSWTTLGLVYLINGLHPTLNVTVLSLIMGNLLTTAIALSDAIVGRVVRER